MTLDPTEVMPREVSDAVRDLPYWFVIGGQAVRCFCPYRPSRDVAFGVVNAADFAALLEHLLACGPTEVLERTADTAHLRVRGIDVSVFLLEQLAPFVDHRHLSVDGVLATKLHAILDRGTRRDFFDLYVTLQMNRRGIADCLSAMRLIHKQNVNDQLLLRALTYFDDAEREAKLPGEGKNDWRTLKDFFVARVGQLLVPPAKPLEIQLCRVDVLAPQ